MVLHINYVNMETSFREGKSLFNSLHSSRYFRHFDVMVFSLRGLHQSVFCHFETDHEYGILREGYCSVRSYAYGYASPGCT